MKLTKKEIIDYYIFCRFHIDHIKLCKNTQEIFNSFLFYNVENQEDIILLLCLLNYGPNNGKEKYKQTLKYNRAKVQELALERMLLNIQKESFCETIYNLFYSIYLEWYLEYGVNNVVFEIPFISEKAEYKKNYYDEYFFTLREQNRKYQKQQRDKIKNDQRRNKNKFRN